MLELSHFVLVVLLLVASVTDIRQGRIFNWITYPVMNDWLVSGDNSVTIKHKKGSTATVVVRDVHIKVDY